MNKCSNYQLLCPYALQSSKELPCIGSQENCDAWRGKYQREAPEEFQKAMDERQKLAELRHSTEMTELERTIAECYH